MAQLPLYHSAGGKPQYPMSRRSFSFKDRHLLLIILVVFAIICLGSLYYAPEVMEQVSFDVTYRKFIGWEDENNNVLLENADNAAVDDQVAPSKTPVEQVDQDPGVGVIGNQEEIEDGKVEERREVEQKEVVVEHEVEENVEDVQKPQAGKDNDKVEHVDPGNSDDVTTQRREKVKEMMVHAWSNYVKYAWGQNELRPISKSGHSAGIFGQTALGATIIDAADTLYIMGLHDEYQKARDWIANSFDVNSAHSDVSVFEFNIRFLGGLLSLYGLTKDEVYKTKATQVADKLLPAFNTPTGIPNAIINLRTGSSHNWGWASGGCSILAEFGTLHLEFQYLTSITGNPVYLQKVQRIRQVLKEIDKPEGLYFNYLNPRNGNWGTRHCSIGALGDSFFEYLVKSWVGTSEKDVEAKDMYFTTMKSVERLMLKKSPSGLVYIGNYKNGRIEPGMEHLACFSGGMYALASEHIPDKEEKEHTLKIGADLTSTCHESYARSATHIGPDSFSFGSNEAQAVIGGNRVYLMRPEVVESYFVLWRVTHENKYRDWAWDAVQGMNKHCRVDGGFSGLRDVYNENSSKDDVQQSFFLAETLKYLYLIFCDDSLISLDKYVFNTEAHPIPVLPDVPKVSKR